MGENFQGFYNIQILAATQWHKAASTHPNSEFEISPDSYALFSQGFVRRQKAANGTIFELLGPLFTVGTLQDIPIKLGTMFSH